jgi:hypothetical protein
LLTSEGGLPEVVRVFVEGRQTSSNANRAKRNEQIKDATTWLLEAVTVAALDADIADGIKQLLGALRFTTNLGAAQQWTRLEGGCKERLEAVGKEFLAPLFIQHNLAERMGAIAVSQTHSLHRIAARFKAEHPGKKLTQREVMAPLFELLCKEINFADPAAMPEHVALYAVLIIQHLLNDGFLAKVEAAAKRAGCKFSGAFPKGFARYGARFLVQVRVPGFPISLPRMPMPVGMNRTVATHAGLNPASCVRSLQHAAHGCSPIQASAQPRLMLQDNSSSRHASRILFPVGTCGLPSNWSRTSQQ